jgi:hypothetical protein
MSNGEIENSGLAERGRERARGNLAPRRTAGRTGGQQNAIKRAGVDPIGHRR